MSRRTGVPLHLAPEPVPAGARRAYGDLIDEWLAERQRRWRADYVAPIAAHGRWNRFLRDFFADPANAGKSLRAAASLWSAIKHRRGEPRYRPRRGAG